MRLLLLHGPNLQLLGRRSAGAPGEEAAVPLAEVEAVVRAEVVRHAGAEVRALQSNHEGALLDALQEARAWASGVVLNPGVLGHTSWVLREAVACAGLPVVEVQWEAPSAGEPWRRAALLEGVAAERFVGRGLQGYLDAVRWFAAPGSGRAAVQEGPVGAPGVRAGPGATSPGVPSSSARDCAFCAEAPCELHRGSQAASARTQEPGRAAESAVRLRALEADRLLQETERSIARVRAGLPDVPPGRLGGLDTADRPAPAAPPKPAGAPGGVGARKSLGPAASTPAARRKTLGRGPQQPASVPSTAEGGGPLRARLAQMLAAHLAGALPAAELAAFARAGWMAQDGDAALEPALRQLMFQDRPGAALDADGLVSLLASLQ